MNTNPLHITGILAMLGALIYAIGDVLLLAGKVNMDDYPNLKRFQKLLSDAEGMIALSPRRLTWGALLGVFATPLVLAGYWQVYRGLSGANETLVFVTILLFGFSSVIGAFVHGTFYYIGEYVHALNKVDEHSQVVIADMIERHRKVLIITYAPVMISAVIASILFSIMVGTQNTLFPVWMAAANPVILIIAWLILKRFLPAIIREWTTGAGFNIAYFVFFTCTTLTLWNIS